MTGMTIILKQGKTLFIGKVRHSGYDIVEFLETLTKDIFASFSSPQEFWDSYLNWRRKDMDEVSLDCEIDTKYDKGFTCEATPIVLQQIVNSRYTFNDLHVFILRQLQKVLGDDREDGYFCGYGDYEIFVDFNSKSIWTSWEEQKPPAVIPNKLRDFLTSLSPEDKDQVWEYLDCNPDAIEHMIECVGTEDGTPNVKGTPS